MVDGGYEYDGTTEIRSVNESEIRDTINKLKKECAVHVVISGVFSPVNPAQENKVRSLNSITTTNEVICYVRNKSCCLTDFDFI